MRRFAGAWALVGAVSLAASAIPAIHWCCRPSWIDWRLVHTGMTMTGTEYVRLVVRLHGRGGLDSLRVDPRDSAIGVVGPDEVVRLAPHARVSFVLGVDPDALGSTVRLIAVAGRRRRDRTVAVGVRRAD